MKTLAIATVIASILAGTFSVNAAPRVERFDAAKFWADIADRSGQ